MMPSCDQIGVPIHFHSSTTSGSASLMSLRILLRVSPRQSPSSAILFEMSSDADWPWLAPDFFMFSPRSSRYIPNRRVPAQQLTNTSRAIHSSEHQLTRCDWPTLKLAEPQGYRL